MQSWCSSHVFVSLSFLLTQSTPHLCLLTSEGTKRSAGNGIRRRSWNSWVCVKQQNILFPSFSCTKYFYLFSIFHPIADEGKLIRQLLVTELSSMSSCLSIMTVLGMFRKKTILCLTHIAVTNIGAIVFVVRSSFP